MNRPVTLALAVLLAFSTFSFAQQSAETPSPTPASNTGQQAPKVQEPEYMFILFYLDPTGALVPLERQQSNTAFKVKYMGYGGAQSSTTYKGAKSPVRFKAGQDIQFVVRVQTVASALETEPDGMVNLSALKTSKDERSIIFIKTGPMGFGAKSDVKAGLPLKYNRYGERSLKVSPAEPLEPGEYVMKTGASLGGFLFGVDPK